MRSNIFLRMFLLTFHIYIYSSILAYVFGAEKNGSFEYPQQMFWLRNKKLIFSVIDS